MFFISGLRVVRSTIISIPSIQMSDETNCSFKLSHRSHIQRDKVVVAIRPR